MSESRAPRIETEQGVTVISLGPEYESLDESLLDELRDAILNVADTATPAKVALDLAHTKFFGSAFIEIMFRAWKRLKSRGGIFAISGLTPYCAEVVTVTHLDRLWTIYDNREQAVREMENGGGGDGETGR